MEPGTLAKVLRDFLTTVDGELSLRKSEYFLVHRVIDKLWCYGQSHEKMGRFPINNLVKVDIPVLSESEELFLAIATFDGERDGDLSFRQGQLIIGTYETEPNWYSGYIGSKSGVFPTTFTWRLDSTLLKKPLDKKLVRKKARVKTSLKAQLDEELDLNKDEIVTVIEIVEDGWCRGVTEDGRTGIFPELFVNYLEDDDDDDETDRISLGNGPVSSFLGEEPAPNYYDLFPETLKSENLTFNEHEHKHEDDNEKETSNSLGVEPYAITLFPFNSQFPNELSFGAGEVVALLRHIDSEWAEGAIDGAKGIFPVSYVNVIVDCAETRSVEKLEDAPEASEYEILEPGARAKVEYTFAALMNGDLSVTAGQTVVVLETANKDWVTVRNDLGDEGLCPRSYLTKLEQVEDDFVLLEDVPEVDKEQAPKRKSVPHRPAPPAPVPGSTPLRKPVADDSQDPGNEAGDSAALEKQKRADHRQNVISELVMTEKEYVKDLKLTYEAFNLHDPGILRSHGICTNKLFGNMLEVIQVAEELLDMILKAMKGCHEDRQQIGPCFLRMADKLQSVYVKYCANHEAALALLEKYEENKEIMGIFDKGIETLRYQMACFDMSSILIKPVQRILKYPLMLYELVKSTEDSHPDKPAIEEAWKAMTNVASSINEYKRRKDITSKYLDGQNTLMAKMSKLNMHSVMKISSRLSARLSASLGLNNLSSDPAFDEVERRFKHVEKCTLQLAKDIEQCLLYLKEEALAGEVLLDFLTQYYQGKPSDEVRKLRKLRSLIYTQFIDELQFEKRVIGPVETLLKLLGGPGILIAKRHDKLLDYDAAISKSEKYKDSRIVQEELVNAKSNYEALNQQLLEELPIMIEVATNILVSVIGAFTYTRKLYCGKITKHYLTLSEYATEVTPQNILESYLVRHSLLWNQMVRFRFAGTNPRVESTEIVWCPQSGKEQSLLRSKYPSNQLYTVCRNFVSKSSLELGAAVGTLVGVIKRQDPMGDPSRWFVDNGVTQGFILADHLQPSSGTNRYSTSSSLSELSSTSSTDLMSLDSPVKESTRNSVCSIDELLGLNLNEDFGPESGAATLRRDRSGSLSSTGGISASGVELRPKKNERTFYANLDANPGTCLAGREAVDGSGIGTPGTASPVDLYQNVGSSEYYYAEFDFHGKSPGTLSIAKGQALQLIRPHDEKGNAEWWLMKNRYGESGYVPHNYLKSSSEVLQ